MPDFVIAIMVGLVAGWLANIVLAGSGPRYIVAGVLGAFYGVVAFANIRFPVGEPLVVEIILAAIGAIIPIVGFRLFLRS